MLTLNERIRSCRVLTFLAGARVKLSGRRFRFFAWNFFDHWTLCPNCFTSIAVVWVLVLNG